MFRRVAPNVVRQAGTRSFFYPGGGESGIWASSLKRAWDVTQVAVVVCAIGVYRVVFHRYSTKRQFLDETTDLWNDDGTVMEGEEAVANLRIQHERIMPYMNQIQEKLEAAGSA